LVDLIKYQLATVGIDVREDSVGEGNRSFKKENGSFGSLQR